MSFPRALRLVVATVCLVGPLAVLARSGLDASSDIASAHAGAPYACTALFVGGKAPDVLHMEQISRARVLCFRFYATMASGVTRTPLWSAERLTVESVAGAKSQTRDNAFHTEAALAPGDRSELSDYHESGFDRGHMAPSGDMPDPQAQWESFSLANMVPQSPDNNRHLWQGIEIATRAMAKSRGTLYVVTGPAFPGAAHWLNGRVAIPPYIWKAIYDPAQGAAAYLTANRSGNDYAVISIATLERITGIDPFPSLSDDVKGRAIALPPPRPGGRRLKSGPVTLAALGVSLSVTGAGATTIATPAPAATAQGGAPEKMAKAGKPDAAEETMRSSDSVTAARRTESAARAERVERSEHEKKAARKDDGPLYDYGYALGQALKRLGHRLDAH